MPVAAAAALPEPDAIPAFLVASVRGLCGALHLTAADGIRLGCAGVASEKRRCICSRMDQHWDNANTTG